MEGKKLNSKNNFVMDWVTKLLPHMQVLINPCHSENFCFRWSKERKSKDTCDWNFYNSIYLKISNVKKFVSGNHIYFLQTVFICLILGDST